MEYQGSYTSKQGRGGIYMIRIRTIKSILERAVQHLYQAELLDQVMKNDAQKLNPNAREYVQNK